MKTAFVIPWYGKDIPGGAESLCRAMARQLKRAGTDVEILTTCLKEFRSDWNENFYPPGVEVIEDIPVRRFPVRKINRQDFDSMNRRLMNGGAVSRLISPSDEQKFIAQMVQSEGLVDFMRAHESEYTYLLMPYMFGTTYYGALACPERSVLIPCLHDESYAYMEIYQEMFKKARGIIFNTPSEKALAKRIYGISDDKSAFCGAGVDPGLKGDGARFKAKHGLDQFLLYAGRKDEGKNIRQLISYFSAYKECVGGKLKLVLIGSGLVDLPSSAAGADIVDLGFVDVQDKWDAYAGAVALCNPSLNESFSIVLMESWLAGTPVLVNEQCEVTRDHCVASKGGLYYRSFEDFLGCLDYLISEPEKAGRMGRNGGEYVTANFSWPRIISKYQESIGNWGLGG